MISVCIATYNGEKYIKAQLLSIISQLHPNDEIIISDDGSCDRTVEIINSLCSPFIRIFINQGEHGYTSNFENALRQATGDYIFLSDQDDIWKDNKVTKTIDLLQTYDFVVSDATIIKSDGIIMADSYYLARRPYKGFLGNLLKFGYLGCCMAFKREILNKALPFPANHSMCTHDNWLFLIGLAFFNVIVTDDKLIYYRRHKDNVSAGGLQPTTSFSFKIKYRVYIIVKLIMRCFSPSQ